MVYNQGMSRWKRFQRLKWGTPYGLLLPHGYSGLCSLLLGFYLLYTSHFKSTLSAYGTSLPYCYTYFTMMNAMGGYHIVHKAPIQYRLFFKACAVFQCVSCYYVIRFLPTFYTRIPYPILRTLDCAMVIPFLFVGISFLSGVDLVRKQSPTSALAIIIGTVASTTTFVYPVHLVHDANWLDCILQKRYSAEDVALSAYVYLPTTICFSLMIFSATLLLRHVISDLTLGVTLGICIIGTVVLNLIFQKFQLPDTSGQQIFMPCPAPAEGSILYRIEQLSDPSELIQQILSYRNVQHIFHFIGVKPITDHTSYRYRTKVPGLWDN